MSDTPRSDAEDDSLDGDLYKLACEMEREISRLKAELDQLRQESFDIGIHSTFEIAGLQKECDQLRQERKYMPIHSTPFGIEMDLLKESQAQENHSQTLKRLKERGGISLCEAIAIMEGRRYHRQTAEDAVNAILKFLRGKAQ